MKKFIINRMAWAIFIMYVVSTILFFGIRLLPSGPAEAMLGAQATDAAIEALNEQMGLDRPLYVQYFEWLTNIILLDFGTSNITGSNINQQILNAIPKTASIAFVGTITGLVIAIPAGIISATRRKQLPDYVATIIAFLGLSLPSFFFGIILLLVFSVNLGLFPTYGYTPVTDDPRQWFRSILLPGIAVGLPYAAITMRMLRSSLLEVLNQPYMQTARAKGLDSKVRIYKHALQNAFIPVITVIGIQVGLVVVSGSVAVEIVFGIRGIGRLLIESIQSRDYQLTQVLMLFIAGFMTIVIILMDLCYTVIDPRIKYE